MKNKEQTCDVINFYQNEECSKFAVKYENPNFNLIDMPLKHPLQMVITGCSGSGKSNILLNIINKMNSTFNFIKIFTQNKNEQLYEFLQSKIPKPYLEIFEGIQAFNDFDVTKLDKGQYLFIYDDFCIESGKKQKKIEEMYIRGRKMADSGGISNVYLTQSYYDTPKVIRKQAGYVILKKINGKLELASIIRDCSLGDVSREQLFAMYEFCCKSKEDISNFLLIDKTAPSEYLFRKNFNQILDPSQF